MAREEGARTRNDAIGITSIGNGLSPVAQQYCVVEEQGNGAFKKTVISLTNCPITVGNTTGISFGKIELYDFPECRFQLLGGRCDIVADWSAEASIGQAGSGDVSLGTGGTADGVLSALEVDIMASVGLADPAVLGRAGVQGNLVKDTEFDGSGTAKKLWLNLIIDDTDVADLQAGTVLVSGEIVMLWLNYGDHASIA